MVSVHRTDRLGNGLQGSYNINTLCPKKNAIVGFWSISPSNPHQIWKVRSLDFEFWTSRSCYIGAITHQGSFSFFTWKVSTIETTLLDLQNLNLSSSITFSDIFYTNDTGFNKNLLPPCQLPIDTFIIWKCRESKTANDIPW